MAEPGRRVPEADARGNAQPRHLFAQPGFSRLFAGQALSGFGDWIITVALIALALDLSGSATAVGGILVLRLAPAALAAPLANSFVRRWNRRRTMLAMDATRAAVVILIPLVGALWWIYLWAFALEVCGLVFLPARDASIPELVPGPSLDVANGLMLASSYGTIPLGAGAFAIISALTGGGSHARLPFLIAGLVDAVTFLASFVVILGIRQLDGGADSVLERQVRPVRRSLDIPLVRAVLPVAIAAAIGLGALFSLGIVYVRSVMGASTAEFGVLVVCFGVGAALGLAVLRQYDGPAVRALRAGLAVQGVVVGVMSLAPSLAVLFLGAVMFGMATAAVLALSMTILQTQLSQGDRVAAFTVLHLVIRGGLVAAAIGAGAAADLVGAVDWPVVGVLPPVRVVLLSSGLVVLATAVTFGRIRVFARLSHGLAGRR